jgi:hypothetical protein
VIAAGVVAAALVAVAVVVMATGTVAPYELYTHCGIRNAEFESRQFYADPPLNDGNGNPPAGWGNPTDSGFMVVKDHETIEFIDWFDHRASFSTHPSSGIPTLALCS